MVGRKTGKYLEMMIILAFIDSFGLMEQKIGLFESLDEFVYWYNYLKPHMSLNFD